MFRQTFLVTYCLLLLSTYLHGQSPYSHHFDMTNGLPSNEVYDVAQDENGYMWFATDHGLVRYNGFDFVVFTMKDGLEDNTILSFFFQQNQIYFSYFNGGLGVLKDSKPTRLEYSKAIREKITGRYVSELAVTKDSVFVRKNNDSKDYDYYSVCKRNLEVAGLTMSNGISALKKGSTNYFAERVSFLMNAEQPKSYSIKDFKLFKDQVLGPAAIKKIVDFKNDHLIWFALTNDRGSSSEVLANYELGKSFLFDGEILTVRTSNERIFVSSRNGLYVLNKEMELMDHLLPGKIVTSSLVDREGDLWVTTHNHGIRKFSKHQVWSGPFELEEGRKIEMLVKSKKACYAITNSRNFQIINMFNGRRFLTQGTSATVRCQMINNQLFFHNTYYQYYIFDENTSKDKTFVDLNDYYIGNNLVYYRGSNKVNRRGLGNLKVQTSSQVFKKIDLPVAFCATFATPSSVILYSGNYCFNVPKDPAKPILPYFEKNIRVRDIKASPNEQIRLFVSKSNGVYLERLGKRFNFTFKDGLCSEILTDGCFENDSTIWVSSFKGMDCIKLDLSGRSIQIKSIQHFNNENILPFNNIHFCEVWKGKLFFASSDQTGYIDLGSAFTQSFESRLVIEAIFANGKEKNGKKKLRLSSDQRNIRIQFQSIQFSDQSKLVYRYKLSPNIEEWIETTNNVIDFPNLSSGDYTFHVQCSSDGNVWSHSKAVRFTILPKLYETLLFKVILCLLAILLLGGMVHWLIKRNKKKALIANRIIESEQKALRSQMNPHFIFNSLNSIQYFISKNKSYEANIYLSKFAQLIRRNFEHSRMGFVSIEQELELLQGYVELEELRFSDQFDVEWSVHSELDFDIKIPSMIIQPFIENAILHGLTPLESRKGILKIELFERNDYVEVAVSDNGYGFLKETKVRNELKKSSGIEIVKERLALYSIKLKHEISYDITTSKNGTKVIVKFPILNEEALIP